MIRINRLLNHTTNLSRASSLSCLHRQHLQQELIPLDSLPTSHPSQRIPTRFFDFYQLGNKDAIEKERARLNDEMNRGYFADMAELKNHGGKIAMANKIIIPEIAAVKFPDFEGNYADGSSLKLPLSNGGNVVGADASTVPKVSLFCLSFRANSQAMIDSWTAPFVETFHDAKNIHLYQVSFIDSWLLCQGPIKWLLLRTMKKPKIDENVALQKQIVYSFRDHYYFRKELKILNLLTGYIFLLDKFGRIRWQGFGLATEDELASLLSCTSYLLEEQ